MQEIRCFLIDEDEDDWELFQLALNKLPRPSVLTCAINCESGLKMLNEIAPLPNYIFLDLTLGVTSGAECLEIIRKNPRLEAIPTVIVSSAYNPTYDDKLRMLNALHFLVKPVKNDTLSSLLSEIFNGTELPYLLTEKDATMKF